MNNKGVKCNVCECEYNVNNCGCCLDTVEITHEKTGADAIATPHFCKSYKKCCCDK
ncbi:MAG: DUF1540 domain-containing protein [Clostridia bacterium]